MDISLLALVYNVLPCVVAVYAGVVYLASPFIPPRAAWATALTIAALLTIGATFAMQRATQGLVPVGGLIKAYAVLYFIPAFILTAAGITLRTRVRSRWFGTVLLLVLALAVTLASRYMSGAFFDLVDAYG